MRIFSDIITKPGPLPGKYGITCPGFILFFLSVAFLSSCSSNEINAPFHSGSDGIYHATGFDIEVFDDYTLLSVYNPFQGARDMVFRYVLTGRDKNTDKDLPGHLSNVPVIRTPVASVICLSTTHIALLDYIDQTQSIVAVSGGEYIYNDGIRKRIENGELPGIGYDMSLDYERILELNPEIILAYGVGAEAAAWLDRLRSLGMNVVIVGEYLEGSPLAQAEWVKFIAHFFDKQDMAAEKFSVMEQEYLGLTAMAAASENKPVVMSGLPWRNSWFVPGGNSLFAALISDAGGRYLWDNDKGRENFPVDIEKVIERGSTADYWINAGAALSGADILNTDERLGSIRPFRLNNVYNNNARLNIHSGNDYWESGIVSPHIILKDLVHILHPALLPGHTPVYYRKL
jgi:iron complex transport system substrate-binding protein